MSVSYVAFARVDAQNALEMPKLIGGKYNEPTTKIDPINRDDEADSELNKAIRLLWCAREDLNLHSLAATTTSK